MYSISTVDNLRPTVLSGKLATGVKTITGSPVEIFAGVSKMEGRKHLRIRNSNSVVDIKIGPSNVTADTGWTIEAGGEMSFDFDFAVHTPIYAVSTAGAVRLEVFEA